MKNLGGILDAISRIFGEGIPEGTLVGISDEINERLAGEFPDGILENILEEILDEFPARIPGEIPKETPGAINERIPKGIVKSLFESYRNP